MGLTLLLLLLSLLPTPPQSKGGHSFLLDVGATEVGRPIQNFAGSPEEPVAELSPRSSDSLDIVR